ncbi:23514_t:CDS:2 [Dentiscutata erythropus]|uniref:23514_t:CDS:1 n=1 Tax=Dentiscutata erythropus TaxID=1348616 RepID=A0A9N9EQC3_9GLOM|nr:23514_t:CDS:2 [Dentiscutata erythropus]
MTRSKRPITEEIDEVEEIIQIEKVQKRCGRGNCSSSNCGGSNCGRGNRGKGNLGRETSHEEDQHNKERETNNESFAPNIGDDLDLNYKEKIKSHVEYNTNSKYNTNATSSTADSESNYQLQNQVELPVNNRSEMELSVNNRNERVTPVDIRNESSHQLQSRVLVSELLQISDDDISDDSFRMLFIFNAATRIERIMKNQQKSNKKDKGDNEANQSLRIRDGKFEALNDMTNMFEVCQWLVFERPDILQTAIQMRNAMQTSLDSPIVMVSQPEIVASQNAIATDDKGLAWLWHEEIKCLFFRCRNPLSGAIETLITKIFKYELYSNEAIEIICYLKRVLTDFRSKFNQKITMLVQDFKKNRSGERTLPPSRSDIDEFITQEVAEQILQRYLNSTNIDKIKTCGTMGQLIKLVKEAFRIFFNIYNIEAIKRLNYLTVGCKTPSRSGKSIASEIFLKFNNNNNCI